MNTSQRNQASTRGYGKVTAVLHTAKLLHDGWEMDNQGWIVELEDKRQIALTTDHGEVCVWTKEEAEEKLAETEKSALSLRSLLRHWPVDPSMSPPPLSVQRDFHSKL